jgi:YfiH family protein
VFWDRQSTRGRAGIIDVAFTDRHGGVSPAPYDTLNLGTTGAHAATHLAANLARLAEAFDVESVTFMRQVHGSDVCVVTPDTSPGVTCDALVTVAPSLALGVRVADCVPVVLADADAGVVGVAHAGRDGVRSGVVVAAVEQMRDLGADRVEAWVGPHVCGGCYEVPAELRAEVALVVPSTYATTTWGTPSLDLGAGVRAQLADAMVDVHRVTGCTRESPDLYSYRRDHEQSGRFAGLVVLRERLDG